MISQRTGKIAQEFIEAVYPDDYDPEVWGAPKKAASSLTSKSEMKINVDNVEKLIKKGKVSKKKHFLLSIKSLTVNQLTEDSF